MVAVDGRQAAATELRRLIETEAAAFPKREAVWQALQARGKLLSPEGGFAWTDLALIACDAAGAVGDAGPVIAAATECLMAALDIIDDIQDADAPDALYRSWGIPTSLNVAMLLLFLSHAEVNALSDRGVEAARIAAASRTLATAAGSACSGQQEDLDGPPDGRDSEDQYLAMIGRKSASLVQGICRAAALLGGADAADTIRLADFGFNVGMAMQILNDVAGASAERAERGDLSSGKTTLPLIFARQSGRAPFAAGRHSSRLVGESRTFATGEIERTSELLEVIGALEYARTIADLYWERALTRAHALLGGGDRLEELVGRLRGDGKIDGA